MVVGPRERLATTVVHLDETVVHEALEGVQLDVRVRYRGRALRGTARRSGDGVEVTLHDPADGVAEGQTAALYRDGRLVGAGTSRRSR